MKKALIIIAIILSVILIVTIVGVLQFNLPALQGVEVLAQRADNLINDEFYDENYIANCYYDYEDEDGHWDYFETDDSYPENRYFLIKTEEEYREMFKDEAEFDVDFDNRMLVVLSFMENQKRTVKVLRASAQGDTLQLKIWRMRPKLGNRWDGTSPDRQRYLVLEMNKSDVNNVEVEYYVNELEFLNSIVDFLWDHFNIEIDISL